MAGVFAVIGVLIASVAAVVGVFMCKRRRRRHIRDSISRPLPMPDNPFEDPRQSPTLPQMQYAPSDSSHRNLIVSSSGPPEARPQSQRTLLDDEFEDAHISTPVMAHDSGRPTYNARSDTGFAGVGAGGKSIGRPSVVVPPYNGPFSDYHQRSNHQQKPSIGSVGLGIRTEPVSPQAPLAHPRRPSSVTSTPSIYPPSLPAEESEDTTHDSYGPTTPSTEPCSPLSPTDKPPRPPRLRPVEPMGLNTDGRPKQLSILTDLAAQNAEDEPSRPLASPLVVPQSPNLFADYNQFMSGVRPPVDIAKLRENFYTRRNTATNGVSTSSSFFVQVRVMCVFGFVDARKPVLCAAATSSECRMEALELGPFSKYTSVFVAVLCQWKSLGLDSLTCFLPYCFLVDDTRHM